MLEQAAEQRLSSRGNALIEFAFILPLMGLLLVGAIDFARVFYSGVTLTNAVRAGLSYGHLNVGKAKDFTAIMQRVVDEGQDIGLELGDVTAQNFCECADGTAIACNQSCTEGAPRLYIEVTADWTFTTMVNYPGIPNTVAMHRVGRMRAQ